MSIIFFLYEGEPEGETPSFYLVRPQAVALREEEDGMSLNCL
jgi:hypothetical protein